MPTKRTRKLRIADTLSPGQRLFLAGRDVLDEDCDLGAVEFSRACWLRMRAAGEIKDEAMPDGSPGPGELWALHGRDAMAAWRREGHSGQHPLVALLGS